MAPSPRRSRPPVGAPAPPIQPVSTRVIDLAADEDALWGDLRKKWRQYVNKARSGGVRSSTPARAPRRVLRDLPRDRGPGRVPDPDPVRLPRRVGRVRPAGHARLLFAETADGSPVATLFLVRAGPRVVEPYGGMTQAGADSRANYLLKWEAIRSSREQGATSYDLWGLAHPRDRALQDRLRGPRDRLRRGVGPRARPARPPDLRRGPADAGADGPPPARAAGRRLGVGLRRRPGRRLMTTESGSSRAPRSTGGTRWRSTARAATCSSRGHGPSTARRAGGSRGSWLPATRGRWPWCGRGRSWAAGPRTCRAARSWTASRGRPTGRAAPSARRWSRWPRTSSARASTSSPPIPRWRPTIPRTPGRSEPPASTRSPRSSPRGTGCGCRCRPTATRRRSWTASRRPPASGSAGRSATASPSSAGTRTPPRARSRGHMRATEPPAAALGRFYDLLRATGDRRGFGFAGADEFVTLVGPRRSPPGTSSTWRRAKGRSTATSSAASCCIATGGASRPRTPADRAERRHDHPGAMHLLRWRAIELALAERRTEMDLGGVDVAGARRPPTQGEPTYGLYEHKKSFGATWVALAGAQERVARPWRYLAGRTRLARRPRGRPGSGRLVSDDEGRIAELLAAAEPSDPRPLGDPDRAPAGRPAWSAAPGATASRSARPASATSPCAASPTTRARWARGPCSWRFPASTSTGTTTSARRRRRRGGRHRRASGGRRRAAPAGGVGAAGRARPAGGLVVRGPVARHRDDRDHRHGRQDHDLVPRRGGPGGRRAVVRPRRHGRDADRGRPRAARRPRDDARRARAAGDARGHGPRGQPGRRAGDDVARPRARPGRSASPGTRRCSRT